MKKILLFYVLTIVLFALGVGLVLKAGSGLSAPPGVAAAVKAPEASSLWSALQRNSADPLSKLLLQFVVIVLATRGVGWVCTKIGQPSVIGEIAAGVLLGPSLLGWAWPEASSFLFAKDTLGTLRLISQVGVCVFMFVVGMELDLSQLK